MKDFIKKSENMAVYPHTFEIRDVAGGALFSAQTHVTNKKNNRYFTKTALIPS